MRFSSRFPLLVLLSLLLASSGGMVDGASSANPAVTFSDVAGQAGLADIDAGPLTNWSAYGPGVAFADYDGDGDLDLYVTARFDHLGQESAEEGWALNSTATGETHLLRNDDGNYVDVSVEAGVKLVNSTALGASWGDIDGDGDVDLYISNYGRADFESPHDSGEANQMFLNNGDGTFNDVTEQTRTGNPGHSSGSAFFDYDHDGDLDLYSLNFGMIDEQNSVVRAETNILYRNDGDADGDGVPEFTDATRNAGPVSGGRDVSTTPYQTLVGDLYTIAATGPENPSAQMAMQGGINTDPAGTGMSWAISIFDHDGDGWEDIFIATDFGISPLYRNNGDGTFTLDTQQSDMVRSGTGMGAHVADIDHDGDLDLCQSNFGPNFLWLNEGDGTFDEEAHSMGLHNNRLVNWDCHFFDYDLDGDMDLWFGAGRINPYITDQNNSLYRNDGDIDGDGMVEFTDVAPELGLAGVYKTMGATIIDHDDDGDMDIMMGNSDAPLMLFENDAADIAAGHWLKVRLEGRGVDEGGSNLDGIGAMVRVTDTDGRTHMLQMAAGEGFLGSQPAELHFGLGAAQVERLEVDWSTGHTQVIEDVPSDVTVNVQEELPTEAPTNHMPMVVLALVVVLLASLLFIRRSDS